MKKSTKTNYNQYREKLMHDPEFKKAYDELGPVYELIRAIIRYRIEHGISQKELADKIGTKQSSISRFESTAQMPSFSFIKKIVDALDLELEFHIHPRAV
ncbi:MAG: helix-turn-helix domain-containing protein [Planctomycetia bacterium]|jgi:ribosome-binding protein aMBF1 (putative translation factor)|nr:helix-turn-helix domain-containing protein [Planctomycetia bacterium]